MEPNTALECGAYVSASRDPDLFVIKVTPNGYDKIKVAEKAIFAEIERLKRKPIGQRELARIKRANRNRAADVKSDPLKHAEQVCEAEAVADWSWLEHYDDLYDAVTAKDIMRVARQYLDVDKSTTGRSAAPAKKRSRKSAVDTTDDAREIPVSAVFELPNAPNRDASAPAKGDAVKATNIAARVERFTLSNGLKVLILPEPGCGVVSVSGAIRAGASFAPTGNTMVPELTAKMLMSGSWGLGKHELASRLDAIGADLSFGVDQFAVTFDSTVVADWVFEYLTLLGTVVRSPRFAPAELRRIKSDTEAEITAARGDSSTTATIKLTQSLYPRNHVYYEQSLATETRHTKATSIIDVRAFHAEHYVPRTTVLTIVGDIDVSAVKTHLEQVFGEWKGGKAKPFTVPPVALPPERKRINVPLSGKSSVEILIGVPVSLKKSDSDFSAAELANAALGIDTLSSRLGVAVRTKYGFTYGITSSFDDIRFGEAPWLIQFSVNPANVERALALVDAVVEDFLTNGITDQELADEAGRLYGQHVVSLRTTSGLADTLCAREFRGAPLRNIDQEWKRLNTVTREQVNTAMRKHLRYDRAVTVVVGN